MRTEKQNVKFFEKCELEITYYMENRKKDPDNILSSKKFILDGLVQAGVLENDGWKQIKGFDESWEVDKKNPRVEVEFKEVE
jgi:Holliday junction resolvase RusA-like endonuclease